MEYIINPCSGIKIKITRGQKIKIVDIEGGQVVDFFAELNLYLQVLQLIVMSH